MKFKRPKLFEGVSYSIHQKNKWNTYWEYKHQVPKIQELPKECISWNYLRFPKELMYIPNDSGDKYQFINFTPIKKGDVIYIFDYIGTFYDSKVGGNVEDGFYVEIAYDKVFELINNKLVLVEKKRVDKLGMSSFLWFFDNLRVFDLSNIKYSNTREIIPYYTNIIAEQRNTINKQTKEISELKKIVGNIDARIEEKTYNMISKRENTRREEKQRHINELKKKASEWYTLYNSGKILPMASVPTEFSDYTISMLEKTL